MSRHGPRAGILIAAVLLFLVFNWRAYDGYFHDDDFDNAVWMERGDPDRFQRTILSPVYEPGNFRPTGYYFFHTLTRWHGLEFPKWVAWVHALHVLTAVLVWLGARRLGAGVGPATLGALFFLLHAAILEVVWLPMYAFDLLCGLFAALSFLLYTHGRTLLSFAAFWLAFKAKEPALALPLALLGYEVFHGGKRWLRTAPFFLVAACFGMGGLLANRSVDSLNTYYISLKASDLWNTGLFYAGEVWLLPFGGLLTLALPILFREPAVRIGVAFAVLSLVPVLILPNRISSAYLYLPLVGLAWAIAGLATGKRIVVAGALAALWFPWNLHVLRQRQERLLVLADENRNYVRAIERSVPRLPRDAIFVYSSHPEQFHLWGIRAALSRYTGRGDAELLSIEEERGFQALQRPGCVRLTWIPEARDLAIGIRPRGIATPSYLKLGEPDSIYDLGQGWHRIEHGTRWVESFGTAWLRRPAQASQFELSLEIDSQVMAGKGYLRVGVIQGKEILGTHSWDQAGEQAVRWPVAPGKPGLAGIEIHFEPDFLKMPETVRPLAVRVTSFGFIDERPPAAP